MCLQLQECTHVFITKQHIITCNYHSSYLLQILFYFYITISNSIVINLGYWCITFISEKTTARLQETITIKKTNDDGEINRKKT